MFLKNTGKEQCFCISEKIAFGQHTTLFRYYIMPVAYLLLSVVM